MRNCLSALNDPIWKLIVSILLLLEGAGYWLLCQTAPTAGNRAGADYRPGISVGTAGQRGTAAATPPSVRQISAKHQPLPLSLSLCISLFLSLSSSLSPVTLDVIRHGAFGVKGVQADGQVLTCRMITIRQKTLIAFN